MIFMSYENLKQSVNLWLCDVSAFSIPSDNSGIQMNTI